LLIIRPTGSRRAPGAKLKVGPRAVISILSFVTLRAEVEDHSLAFEVRHVVWFPVLGEVVSESCEEQFALLFEDDGTTAEEDIRFDFVSFLKELDGMFEFEVVIMVVGLRSEPDLLHFHLLGICFRLFLLFLLGIEELLVVHDTAHGRVRGRSYLDQVEVQIIGNFHCLLKGINTLLYIVADEAHFLDTAYLVVDTMGILFDNSTATRSVRGCCYSFFLL